MNGGTGDDWQDDVVVVVEMTWLMDACGLCFDEGLRGVVRHSLRRSSEAKETEDAAGEFVAVEFVRVFASSISPRRNASRYVISE